MGGGEEMYATTLRTRIMVLLIAALLAVAGAFATSAVTASEANAQVVLDGTANPEVSTRTATQIVQENFTPIGDSARTRIIGILIAL